MLIIVSIGLFQDFKRFSTRLIINFLFQTHSTSTRCKICHLVIPCKPPIRIIQPVSAIPSVLTHSLFQIGHGGQPLHPAPALLNVQQVGCGDGGQSVLHVGGWAYWDSGWGQDVLPRAELFVVVRDEMPQEHVDFQAGQSFSISF